MPKPKRSKPRRRRLWHISPEGFRELRHSCFLSQQRCAEFLGVSLRTVRHWDAGRCRVPWAVVRILRLHRLGDLGALHDGWAGWVVNARTGQLVSPGGYTFEPQRLSAWTVICEQARFWRQDYERRTAGGVGALAPARPKAVPLQPEVWQAEVVTEALPPPSPEAAFLLTALSRFLHRGGPLVLEASGSEAVRRGGAAAVPDGSVLDPSKTMQTAGRETA